MKNSFLLALNGLLLLLVGELHVILKPQPTQGELRRFSVVYTAGKQWQGKFAHDFDLALTTGERFKLSENIGKKLIVLNFFATWCGPCRDEMPELERYYEKHKNDPFLLLAIDARETPDQVRGFFEELKLTFPVGIDDGGEIQRSYGVTAFPTTVLIGVDGKVQLYEPGAIANAAVAFDAFLRANNQLLAAGKGITAVEFLKQAGVSPSPPVLSKAANLDARAKRIAARMDCPCGCDLRVDPCTCHTARKIKKELAAGNFAGKTDAEIMTALNKKFCMAGM